MILSHLKLTDVSDLEPSSSGFPSHSKELPKRRTKFPMIWPPAPSVILSLLAVLVLPGTPLLKTSARAVSSSRNAFPQKRT